MSGTWLLANYMSLQSNLHCSYYDSQHASDAVTVLKEPNKEQRERKSPAQGKEMNEPCQWDTTNSCLGWIHTPIVTSLLQLILWVHQHFLLKSVATFSINPCTCLVLKLFFVQRQKPSHCCSRLSPFWTSLWASSDKCKSKWVFIHVVN